MRAQSTIKKTFSASALRSNDKHGFLDEHARTVIQPYTNMQKFSTVALLKSS